MITNVPIKSQLEEFSFITGGSATLGKTLWKTAWQFLTKLNIFLPYDPAVVLLGIYPNELKMYVHTKPCIWKFTATLFIIAKTWKQPRHPSGGE